MREREERRGEAGEEGRIYTNNVNELDPKCSDKSTLSEY